MTVALGKLFGGEISLKQCVSEEGTYEQAMKIPSACVSFTE